MRLNKKDYELEFIFVNGYGSYINWGLSTDDIYLTQLRNNHNI